MKIYFPVSGSHALSNATRIIYNVTMNLLGANRAVLGSQPLVGIPNTDMFLPPGNTDVKWDQVREVEFHVKVEYVVVASVPDLAEVEVSDDGVGKYYVVFRTQVIYGSDGIQFSPGVPITVERTGNGEVAVQLGLGLELPPSKGDITELRLLLSFSAGSTKQGFGLNVYIVSDPGRTTQSSAQKDVSVRYVFVVKDRPQPKPDPIVLPVQLLSHVVIFEREDQQHPTQLELNRLQDAWVRPLWEKAPELATAISQGLCPITLLGHASTPGTKGHNKALSGNRITSVASALRTIFPEDQKLTFVFKPNGETAAVQSGPVANERRVKIVIPVAVATMAIEKLRSYGGVLGPFRRIRDQALSSPGKSP